jgi:polysaccharide export outer membrane protein
MATNLKIIMGNMIKRFLTSIMTLLALMWISTTAFAQEPTYVLGAGDLIRINVFNNPDLTLETRIAEGDIISYPLIGPVKIGGMSTFAAEKKLATMLEKGGYVKNPQVNIFVAQFQSKLVSVLGSVPKPGRYPIERTTNLADLLALVGGVLPDGSDVITVIDGPKKTEYDLHKVMAKADDLKNIVLNGGEVVFVPRAPVFYIYGEVQRPGSYRLERGMTLMQALAQGGGPTLRGTERNIKVNRQNVAGEKIELRPAMTEAIQQDDVIYVQESLF